MGLKSNDKCTYKRYRGETLGGRKDHKAVAEIGVMADTDKECLESPEAGSSQEGFLSRASLIASSASRTVRKQVSSVVSHPLCGSLHGGPRKQMQMVVCTKRK